MPLQLTPSEQQMLQEGSDATRMAMRIVVSAAELLGAGSLIEIGSAHIDGCLHHGDGGVEFAEALRDGGGQVRVPTTLNVGALDLLHQIDVDAVLPQDVDQPIAGGPDASHHGHIRSGAGQCDR